jgi:hypothetical protein
MNVSRYIEIFQGSGVERKESLQMTRAMEWILAAIGATTTLMAGAIAAGGASADLPAQLILAAVAIMGFAGFVAVALDVKGRSRKWGSVTWMVAGALSALVVLAGFSYGPYLIPAVLAFLGAAFLADRRRGQASLPHLGVSLLSAFACALVIILVNVLGWV